MILPRVVWALCRPSAYRRLFRLPLVFSVGRVSDLNIFYRGTLVNKDILWYCRKMAKRTDAEKRAQNKYEAGKSADGEHVQINLKLKTSEDLSNLAKIEALFPYVPRARLVRLAWEDFVTKRLKK